MFQLTYLNVGSGSTPPTQAQAANVNSVNVAVYPASSADTQLNLTHNLQISSADLAAGWPDIGFEFQDNTGRLSNWFIVQGAQNPNYAVLQCGTVANTAGLDTTNQVVIKVRRPHTIVR